jgi:hypothetical protein
MTPFRIIPIETQVVRRLRASRIDEFDNPLPPIRTEPDQSLPCRHCLQDSGAGQSMLLAAYSPFKQKGPYKEVGPVFIHETECARYDAADRIPQQLRNRLLALRGYDFEQRLLGGDVVEGKGIEGYLHDLLAKPEVAFVHVRFARPGCFACLIEPVRDQNTG